MADFPSFGISSPEEAYTMARNRGAVIQEASKHIGEAASQGFTALHDDAVKQKVIGALVSKWPGLQARQQELMDMTPQQLAGQTFLLNSVDSYISAKKAEHPDSGVSFPSAEQVFGADPAYLENIKKMIDGVSESAKNVHEKTVSAKQEKAMAGATTRPQAATAGVDAVSNEPLSEGAQKTAGLYPSPGELMRGAGRAATDRLRAEEDVIKSLKSITDIKEKKRAITQEKEKLRLEYVALQDKMKTDYPDPDQQAEKLTALSQEYHDKDADLSAQDESHNIEIKQHDAVVKDLVTHHDLSRGLLEQMNKKEKEKGGKTGLRPAPAAAPKPTPSGVPVVATQADYDAVPSGSQYKDPQGNVRVKP